MSEINVNTNNLSKEIESLKTLNRKIIASNIACPKAVGGGSSIQSLENIGNKYKALHNNVHELVNNTILFMENINLSYKESDKKASKNFEAGR